MLFKNLEDWDTLFNLCFGGLIAISLIILQDFFSLEKLDVSAFIAVICLTSALPMLTGAIIITYINSKGGYDGGSLGYALLCSGGVVINLIGLGATFWHISWIVCIVYISSSIVTFYIIHSFTQKFIYRTSWKDNDIKNLRNKYFAKKYAIVSHFLARRPLSIM